MKYRDNLMGRGFCLFVLFFVGYVGMMLAWFFAFLLSGAMCSVLDASFR